MYAIYSRQSVERKDSISIEMQTEMCRRCIPTGEKAEIFEDKGYSGTNTKRPAFKKMMEYAKEGRLRGIIVYKLDRISRSLCDFASIWAVCEERKIELISCTEGIDSTTPMGQMLIKLLIMFAEMEQKNISARIRDNYYARAEKMLSLGGRVPVGYNKDFSIEKNGADLVKRCFLCITEGKTLDETGRILGITGTKAARIVRNPVYVRSSEYIVEKLKSEGYKILGREEDYRNGCGLREITSGSEKYIAPSQHDGIIEPELWLAARGILSSRKPSSNAGSGKLSWLQGLIICGKCGSSCYVRDNGRGRPYLYIACQGRRKGICTGLRGVRAENVESPVSIVIMNEIDSILRAEIPENRENSSTELLTFLEKCDDNMGEKMLFLERKMLLNKRKEKKQTVFQQYNGKMWKKLSLQDKKAVAAVLIKNIIVTEEKLTLVLR
ncbi:MAG: recombinase family protein [Ruminococcus sp.]